MTENDEYIQLTDFLREKGHSETEIGKIVAKVKEYEEATKLYSIMDSIGAGALNLGAIINEALSTSPDAVSENDEDS